METEAPGGEVGREGQEEMVMEVEVGLEGKVGVGGLGSMVGRELGGLGGETEVEGDWVGAGAIGTAWGCRLVAW